MYFYLSIVYFLLGMHFFISLKLITSYKKNQFVCHLNKTQSFVMHVLLAGTAEVERVFTATLLMPVYLAGTSLQWKTSKIEYQISAQQTGMEQGWCY